MTGGRSHGRERKDHVNHRLSSAHRNLPDQASAESRAQALCNYLRDRKCTVVVSYTDCGAIAGNGSQWVGGNGPTKEVAEQAALGQLANGTIAKSVCLLPPG